MAGFKNGSLLTRSISLDTDITSVQQVLGADLTRVGVINVNGDPEGVVSANPGSLGLDRTGNLYLKETGTGNTGWSRIDSGADETITGDSGGALSPTAGNWNIFGTGETETNGSGSTLSIKSPRTAQWIVDPNAVDGTHTTIQGAINAASAGDTIVVRSNSTTYTEDLTINTDNLTIIGLGNVNLVQGGTTTVPSITGKITLGTNVNVNIKGFNFISNSDYIIEDTGSTSGTAYFSDSRFDFSNDCINLTNANRTIYIMRCRFASLASSLKLATVTGGSLTFWYCNGSNTSLFVNSPVSGGSIEYYYSNMP
jgi:hypothetical protein